MPDELKHPMKGLINIQNNDNKCFMWCHRRHLNLSGVKLERINKEDREVCKKLNYQVVDFPVSKKDYGKIEVLNKVNINVFCYENKVVYPVFVKVVYSGFSSENVLNEHKKDCLFINKGQNVKLEKGFIKLKGTDCGVDNDCFSYTKKYQDHIPCSFAYKVVCIDDKYSKDVVLYRGKDVVFKFIKCIFKEYGYCRSVMSAEENETFEMTNICWICSNCLMIIKSEIIAILQVNIEEQHIGVVIST